MPKINRDDIIHAAVHLFNASGYHATSMGDIARQVGVKKPSLYHHFESKEAILLTILETGMTRLNAEIDQIAASDADCVTKLRAAITAHARMIASNPEGAAVFLREDRGLGDGYLAQYLERRDHFEYRLRQIIQSGVDEGMFHIRDVAITVEAILGMVNWMTRWYRPTGRLSAEQIADLFAELLLHGLTQSR